MASLECGMCERVCSFTETREGEQQVECSCGYLNLIERNVVELPVADLLEAIAPPGFDEALIADSEDPEVCMQVLRRALEYVVADVRAQVESDPTTAAEAILPSLGHFEARSKSFRRGRLESAAPMTRVARAVQLLVGALFEVGGDIKFDPDAQKRESGTTFLGSFSSVASNAVVLTSTYDNLRGGLLTGKLRSGQLVLAKTEAHTQIREWVVNRERYGRRELARGRADEELFSEASMEAQKHLLGFTPDAGRHLLQNRHRLLREMASTVNGTVYVIPEQAADLKFRALFERLSLSLERVQRFTLPLYWDLGDVTEPGDAPGDVLLKLGERNWFNYYPVIPIHTPSHEQSFVVSSELLTYTLSNLDSWKGRLLERVYHHLRDHADASSSMLRRVARLRSRANRKFESVAATLAREVGFEVQVSLDELEGERLAGGEIDCLMVGESKEGLVLVVAEVKDFGVAFHRWQAIRKIREKIRRAESQLEAKAELVRRHWPRLTDRITAGRLEGRLRSGSLVKLIITSDYLVPSAFGTLPCVAIGDLQDFLESIKAGKAAFSPRFSQGGWEELPSE